VVGIVIGGAVWRVQPLNGDLLWQNALKTWLKDHLSECWACGTSGDFTKISP